MNGTGILGAMKANHVTCLKGFLTTGILIFHDFHHFLQLLVPIIIFLYLLLHHPHLMVTHLFTNLSFALAPQSIASKYPCGELHACNRSIWLLTASKADSSLPFGWNNFFASDKHQQDVDEEFWCKLLAISQPSQKQSAKPSQQLPAKPSQAKSLLPRFASNHHPSLARRLPLSLTKSHYCPSSAKSSLSDRAKSHLPSQKPSSNPSQKSSLKPNQKLSHKPNQKPSSKPSQKPSFRQKPVLFPLPAPSYSASPAPAHQHPCNSKSHLNPNTP